MLRKLNAMKGWAVEATDGDIGTVTDFLLDDEQWAVRYLVVRPEGWFETDRVLISPMSVETPLGADERFRVRLSREQARHSPPLTSLPVPRRYEAEYIAYYGYPPYWAGGSLWGKAAYPVAQGPLGTAPPAPVPLPPERDPESHTQSVRDLSGSHIAAIDGEFGHVDDFLMDEESWEIRYLQIDTSNWIGGKTVLVSPRWTRVNWRDRAVFVEFPRELVKNSPEFDPSQPVTREYEGRLQQHYHAAAQRH